MAKDDLELLLSRPDHWDYQSVSPQWLQGCTFDQVIVTGVNDSHDDSLGPAST